MRVVPRAVLLLLVVAFFMHLFRVLRSKTRVLYCTSSPNEFILKVLARLTDVCHRPTWHSAHPMLNMALYLIKVHIYKNKTTLRREILHNPDNSTVAIDFLEHRSCSSLSPSAPIVLFMHTIAGGATDTAYFLHAAVKRGWRCAVLTRRGHGGLSLSTPEFNIMGDADDAHRQIMHVSKMYPDAWLGLVGISAGSGLLVSYLGKYASTTPIKAACSLCPAYDISRAFAAMGNTLFGRMCESHILTSMKELFLHQNREILTNFDAEAFQRCMESKTMQDFITCHVPFALASSSLSEEQKHHMLQYYMKTSNPMSWVNAIRTPLLVLNAEDDLVCLKANIREDLATTSPGVILVICEHGSHLGFNEGLWGQSSFMTRLTLDFLEAARAIDV